MRCVYNDWPWGLNWLSRRLKIWERWGTIKTRVGLVVCAKVLRALRNPWIWGSKERKLKG